MNSRYILEQHGVGRGLLQDINARATPAPFAAP